MPTRIIGPIEAFKDWWGKRSVLRRSNGTPNRTKAQLTILALQSDLDAWATLQATQDDPRNDLRLGGLAKLSVWLIESQAGEAGWDTAQGIRGIEAATAVRQNMMAKADPDEA